MKFTELVEKLKRAGLNFTVQNFSDTELDFLTADSRKAKPKTIFACVKGEHADGHVFAQKAVKQGASALVCEHVLNINVPQLICRDVRSNMGIIGANLYDNPADKLKLIAITGTTGKTTSTFMTKAILDYANIKCGLLGTVYYDDGACVEEASRTTPEADMVQYKLAQMVKNGCKACVMETSSHSIVQGRITGCKYDVAGFTNLTQDHLDFHKTMQSYFNAKLQLFDTFMRGAWKVSIFIDDKYGKEVFEKFSEHAVSYSLKDSSADYFAQVLSTSINGTKIKLKIGEKTTVVDFPIIGSHNILNALQALSIANMLAVDTQTAIEALKQMPQIPGRLERYMIEGRGSCVIDFAHAPDGMEKLLTALRTVCKGKLISLFGAGGDRDKTKRPKMGEIAAKLSDFVILTTDNPRSEEPDDIIDMIEEGVRGHAAEYIRITNRKEAIYKGLSMLHEGDILAVIGKGPETYMEIKGEKIPFLDKAILLKWCEKEGMKIK